MIWDDLGGWDAGGGWVGGTSKREGLYLYTELIHSIVQQKPTRVCKTTISPLGGKKKNTLCNHTTYFAAALTKSLGGPQLAKHEGGCL